MPAPLQFCFELDRVADVQPWGKPGSARLHWFGLTSGHYWLATSVGEVLRYTSEIQQRWGLNSPYVDYHIARLFEDLQENLPAVLEPIPSDIASIAFDEQWFSRAREWRDEESDATCSGGRWELYDAALSWRWARDNQCFVTDWERVRMHLNMLRESIAP
jgi:hypothetical protein